MQKKLRLRHLIPFCFILMVMVSAYIFIYFHLQTWESLKQFHLSLKDFNLDHPVLTPLFFIILYISYAVLMLPGIALLSLLSGFLFPQPFSTLYVIIAATVGGSLLFLAARTAFTELLSENSSLFLTKLEKGFRRNASNYMLFLRLIPLFPFKIVNLAGAFFEVPFLVFAWTTFIGMIPSVIIYTQAGKGLSFYLDNSKPLNLWELMDPILIVTLASLSLLSLVPILFKKKESGNKKDKGVDKNL